MAARVVYIKVYIYKWTDICLEVICVLLTQQEAIEFTTVLHITGIIRG